MSDEAQTTLPQRVRPGENLPQRRVMAPLGAPEDDVFAIGRYLQILLRRKWLLLAVAATVVAGTILQVITATPLYTAVAILQIDPESENVLPYEEVQSPGSIGGWLLYEYIETQARKFPSERLGERVARRLDLAEDPRFNIPVRGGLLRDGTARVLESVRSLFRVSRENTRQRGSAGPALDAAAATVTGGLGVAPIADTRLIEVSFTAADPEIAAAVANTAMEEFIEQHLEEKYDATLRATDFLRKQLLDLQAQVEGSEERLLAYAQQNNIVDLNDREDLARSRLAALNAELTAADAELIRRSTLLATVRSVSSGPLPENMKTSEIRVLEQRKSELELELAGFSSQYGPEWPEIKSLGNEIAQVDAQLAAAQARLLGSADKEHELALNRRNRLRDAVAAQRAEVEEVNQNTIQLNILRREVDSNKDIYEGILQRLKEASVAAGLRSSNIQIANRAPVPAGPSYPEKYRTVLLSIVAGLALGLAAAIVVDKLDNTLKSADDVSDFLGLPALGVVPSMGGRGRTSLFASLGFRRQESGRHPLIAFDGVSRDGGQRALEAYRSLRTALLLSHSGQPPQAMLVTSALPAEGKSTTAANIAIALSQTGARTLLMECDLRRPSLAEIFGVASPDGMSSYLSGNTDLSSQIQETPFPDLLMVPAGPQPPNPVELLGSEKMRSGLELMREYFTYIVLDSPPVLELSDSLVVSSLVEGSILVARANRTPRKAVAQAAAELLGIGSTLLGVVVNDVDASLHGGGYGSYYAYGSGYYGSAREADEA